MEISSLLKKLKRTPQEEPEQFLAIQIDTEFVKTAVWAVHNQLTEIVAIGSTSEWDGTSTELLVEAIDNSLTIALEKLPAKKEPNKVIFGLPETWASTESVVAPRLADLKTICEKLALKPLGFVVTTEAITHYLRAKEGTPLTGILLRVSTSEVAILIVTVGKIEGTHVAGRSGDLAADVREGLTRFGERESMPSRIVLYNGGEDLQDLTQQLMAFDWQSAFPFLHLPKIEALNDNFSITAIAVAGGAEVAKSLGITIAEPEPENTTESNQLEIQETSIVPTLAEHEIEISMEEQTKPEEPEPIQPTEPQLQKETQERVIESPAPAQQKQKFHLKLPDISGIWKNIHQSRLFKWRPVLPSISLPKGVPLTIIFITVLFFLIGTGFVFAAKYLPRATVRLVFDGQNLSERVNVTVDPTIKSVNPSTNSIPAEKVTVTKSGEKSKDTTGKKTIGDKARGDVKIYNKTNVTKEFSAGTVISTNGKEFALDDSITIPSASQSATTTGASTTFGVASAKVVASSFGPEYNLDANTQFIIANLSPSAFNAVNDSAFTGGTKTEVQAVSKKDRIDLRDALVASLKEEAAGEIESQAGGKKVFKETIAVNPTEEKYSAQAGDETSTIKLSMTADITALAIADTDYQNLLAASLQNKIPDGYTLSSAPINTSVENIQTSGDTVTFDAIITAPLAPKVSETDVINKIVGKRPAAAADIVRSLPHFKSMELTFAPVLPSILQWIPSAKNHIAIEIRLE